MCIWRSTTSPATCRRPCSGTSGSSIRRGCTLENSRTGAFAQHTFLVIAGIGMDAEVVSDTIDGLKKAVGWLAYTEAGVRHLPGAPQEGLDRAG